MPAIVYAEKPLYCGGCAFESGKSGASEDLCKAMASVSFLRKRCGNCVSPYRPKDSGFVPSRHVRQREDPQKYDSMSVSESEFAAAMRNYRIRESREKRDDEDEDEEEEGEELSTRNALTLAPIVARRVPALRYTWPTRTLRFVSAESLRGARFA